MSKFRADRFKDPEVKKAIEKLDQEIQDYIDPVLALEKLVGNLERWNERMAKWIDQERHLN